MQFMLAQVDLLAQEDRGALLVQCDHQLSGKVRARAWVAGQSVHVKLAILEEIPFYSRSEFLQRLLQRLHRRPLRHLYRASYRGPPEFLPYLQVLLERVPQAQEQRVKPRQVLHIRATGPELPEFRAIVRDLSETGIGLDLVGPLQRGVRLHLRLEPEGGLDQPFQVEAEVCWCRPTPKAAEAAIQRTHVYQVGARFLNLRPEARQALHVCLHESAHAQPAPARVLTVDRDRALLEAIAFTLQREGFQALSAPTVESGLKLYLQENPDLLILERALVGSEFSRPGHAPILWMRSSGDPCRCDASDDAIIKPFGFHELAQRVRALLNRRVC